MLQMTTTESLELFKKSLLGNNYSKNSIRAYTDDIRQFIKWVQENRVDWDHPDRFSKIDIVEFLNFLAGQKTTGTTRVRKLAAIRKFFKFLKENNIAANNPAETVVGPIREEKDPEVLYKNEYKALLYEAQENLRDYAILMTFLQTGLRVGELVSLNLDDIDLENKLLIVRQGKGRRDRTIPIEEQAAGAQAEGDRKTQQQKNNQAPEHDGGNVGSEKFHGCLRDQAALALAAFSSASF